MRRTGFLLGLCLLLASSAYAQSLSVAPDASAGQRAVLRVRDILADDELEEAVRSGLPLRMQGDLGRRNRTIRGTYGDGRARVAARSFSGDVVINGGK